MDMCDVEHFRGDPVGLEVVQYHAHGLATSHVYSCFVQAFFDSAYLALERWSNALERGYMDFAVVLLKDGSGNCELIERDILNVLDFPPPGSTQPFAPGLEDDLSPGFTPIITEGLDLAEFRERQRVGLLPSDYGSISLTLEERCATSVAIVMGYPGTLVAAT